MNKKKLCVVLTCVVGMSFTNFAYAEVIPEQSIFEQLLSFFGNMNNPLYQGDGNRGENPLYKQQ
ncbi:MAG: hypothetical protein ABJK37_19195 [Paraglaciecola sp.]|uniref:hypothetical protein n=1 Tax=Paraglaciecola sp. TaxID=1920173 RepID=UPI003298A10C